MAMSWDTDLLQEYVTDAFDVPYTDEEIAKYSKRGMEQTDENTKDDETPLV